MLPVPSQMWSFSVSVGGVNGVAVDSSGFVYLACGDGTLRKFNPGGGQVWSFTGHTGAVNGVAVGADGYIYTAGEDTTVRKVTPAGGQVWSFTGNTKAAIGVTVDSAGNVYSSSRGRAVIKISPSGGEVWTYVGLFAASRSVATVDSQGNVYVGWNDTNNSLAKINSSGSEVWTFTGHAKLITGVVVDADGYTYSVSSSLIKVNPSGSEVWSLSGVLQLIAIDPSGYIYTADSKGTISKKTPSGAEVWSYPGSVSLNGMIVTPDRYIYTAGTDSVIQKLNRVNNRLSATNQINCGISRARQAPLVVRVGEPGQGTAGMIVQAGITRAPKAPYVLTYGLIRKEEAPLLVKVGTPRQGSAGMIVRAGIKRLRQALLRVEVSILNVTGVLILDRYRRVQATLPGIKWNYDRRINEATPVEINIPREITDKYITQEHSLYGFFAPYQPYAIEGRQTRVLSNKAKYAEIASFVQIVKGGRRRVTGKISSRTLGQVAAVKAYTEEILMESNITPAQYGKVWDNWDLADVARDLLDGWQTIRVKDASQWQQYMVASSNVDLTSDPGLVTLAKRPDGRYYESGYIDLLFASGEVQNFKAWDRIRWPADSDGAGGTVQTTIQWSTNGISWSTPWDGGLPEEVGYYIGGAYDQVYVRINLITRDTDSEDANKVPTGITPTVFAVELIARTERGELMIGNIPSTAGVTVKGLSADYASAFRVLCDACEQAGWEFQVWDGALNIAEAIGVDRTADFVLRAGTNTEITTLGDGDDELVNVLTAYGPGQGINRLEITLRDDASIAEFGEYPLAMEFEAETLAELEQKAQEFLSENNSPKNRFEVMAVFDHAKEPYYGLGDRVRIVDPETGIVTTTRIVAESREQSEDGVAVGLELGKAECSLQRALEDGKVRKPLDPLTPTGVYARGIIAGLVVGCAVPKGNWGTTECHLSTAGGFTPSSSTLRTSGRQNRFDIMELTPGVRYYAKVVHVDSDGRRSEPSREVSAVANYVPGEALEDYSIGMDKFMEDVKPVRLVTTRPILPHPDFPAGTHIYPIDEKKLLITPDGLTWDNVGATDFSELTGKITETQIGPGAVTTPALAANAVTADKLFVNTTTTNKIIAGIAQIGGLSADHIKGGEISYEKLNVAYAKVTQAESWETASRRTQAVVTQATSINGWNKAVWNDTLWYFSGRAEIWIHHQALNTLMGSPILQFSRNGTTWSEEIDLAYAFLGGNVFGIRYPYSVDEKPFALMPNLAAVNMLHLYFFADSDNHFGSTMHIRFKRHAIT